MKKDVDLLSRGGSKNKVVGLVILGDSVMDEFVSDLDEDGL